ncbi:MAG: hypothetical protein KJ847_01035 [Firmicutes bacterium]|nr:hypothetical protein [Bacillota bacterium]
MDIEKFIKRVKTSKDLHVELILLGSEKEKQIVNEFHSMKISHKRFNDAWNVILHAIDDRFSDYDEIDFISDETISFLLENDIALCDLGHLKLSNYWLIKIYEKDDSCIEALQTAAVNFLGEKYSTADFVKFIKQINNNFIYAYILFYMVSKRLLNINSLTKASILCSFILTNLSDNPRMIHYVEKYRNFITLATSLDKAVFEKNKSSDDYLVNLALSINPNSSIQFKDEVNHWNEEEFIKNELSYIYDLR